MSDKTNLLNLEKALKNHFGERVRANESLAAHTTLQMGGPADLWLTAQSAEDLAVAGQLAQAHKVSIFMLGGGANLLIGDAGIRGLVIKNQARHITFSSDGFLAESGVLLPRLASQCAAHNLSGLEWSIGVPGTLGGAVVNNAGAFDGDIARNLVRAELLTSAGERVWQSADWFEYEYRDSCLKSGREKAIVLQAEFLLSVMPSEDVVATMQAYTEKRRASQPAGATIGSMFKNPIGDSAGRLIEAAGLKGYQVGQAQISPVHANFFINLGGANADEVRQLIEKARDTVQEKFGITLELEIELI